MFIDGKRVAVTRLSRKIRRDNLDLLELAYYRVIREVCLVPDDLAKLLIHDYMQLYQQASKLDKKYLLCSPASRGWEVHICSTYINNEAAGDYREWIRKNLDLILKIEEEVFGKDRLSIRPLSIW